MSLCTSHENETTRTHLAVPRSREARTNSVCLPPRRTQHLRRRRDSQLLYSLLHVVGTQQSATWRSNSSYRISFPEEQLPWAWNWKATTDEYPAGCSTISLKPALALLGGLLSSSSSSSSPPDLSLQEEEADSDKMYAYRDALKNAMGFNHVSHNCGRAGEGLGRGASGSQVPWRSARARRPPGRGRPTQLRGLAV